MSFPQSVPPLRSLDVPKADKPKRVTVLRGLPGSGKSTAALAIQELYPEEVVRINNDDLSQLLFGVAYAANVANAGNMLRDIRREILLQSLNNASVRLIIVDNTNLSLPTVNEIESLAVAFGCEFIVEDYFLGVPVEVCIERDSLRERSVGAEVIQRMNAQASRLKPWKRFIPVPRHRSQPNKPVPCVLLDLDPVFRWLRDASVSDWINIYRRKLPSPAIEFAKQLKTAGVEVLAITSLSENNYPEASVWANVHVFPGIQVFMTRIDNRRSSALSKFVTYEKLIKPHYQVTAVIGEKQEIVHTWKNIAQLPTFEVSFGDL